MILDSLSDDQLLAGARNGCERSFDLLIRRHQGRVYRFALDLSGSHATAEEASQEVFLALVTELDRYDSSRGSLLPYLLGVARNQTYRLLRRERAYLPLDPPAGEDMPVMEPAEAATILAELQKEEAVETLRSLITGLPVGYREAVVLCDLEELDYAQAAQVLGCPIGTVRSRLHRGRAMLTERWSVESRKRSSMRCQA